MNASSSRRSVLPRRLTMKRGVGPPRGIRSVVRAVVVLLGMVGCGGDKDRAVKLWQRALELLDKEETMTAELRQVKAKTPQKLQAVQANREPPVAPVGLKDKPAPATQPAAGKTGAAAPGTSNK